MKTRIYFLIACILKTKQLVDNSCSRTKLYNFTRRRFIIFNIILWIVFDIFKNVRNQIDRLARDNTS